MLNLAFNQANQKSFVEVFVRQLEKFIERAPEGEYFDVGEEIGYTNLDTIIGTHLLRTKRLLLRLI